jgi:hypothetical protein
MALDPTPELIIDESDEGLGGLYLRADSRTEIAPTQVFAREMKYKRRLRVVRPARESILDRVWESVDLTGAELEVAVGRLDQAPGEGSFSLNYAGSTTNLVGLAFDISETALEAALLSNTTYTAIGTFTVAGSVLTTTGPHALGVPLRVRVSNSGGSLPSPLVAGTDYYVHSTPLTTTLTLSATPNGAQITLTGGSGTHTLHKTADVEQTGRVYRVVTNQYAAQETFTADAEDLSPPSQVIIKHPVVGDADTLDVQTFRVIQQPYAFQDNWTLTDPGTATLTTESSGATDAPAKYQVEFSEPPISGSVRFVHSVPQIWEIIAAANTGASRAQFDVNFVTVDTHEAEFGGSFLDAYKSDNTILRFWFDHNNTSTAPPAPAGVTLIEVDFTTVASLVTAFKAAVVANVEFGAGSAASIGAQMVRVSYAAVGKRTSIDIGGAPLLVSTTTKMLVSGSDGVQAGKYFLLADRNGTVCVYITAGITTAEPDVVGVAVNRFLPVSVAINATATAVATAVAAALEADAEFTAPVPSAVTVTATDFFGGIRSVSTQKTVTFGISIKRAGFNVSASISWDEDAGAIAALIGETRYKVSKPDPLHWMITLIANGAMTTPVLTEENLIWPSRMEGTLDFSTEAIELAFAATTANFLDATIEVVYTPDGGVRRLILQRNVRLQRNMISEGGIVIPPFTTTLTSVKTGKLLWVDQVNGTSDGIRGRLDEPYDDPIDAKADALSGDTIVVLPGTYNITEMLSKDGVNWHLFPGVTISLDSEDEIEIFGDGGAALTYSVTGHADLIRLSGSGSGSPAHAIRASHADSVISIECRDITIEQNSSGDEYGSGITCEAGYLSVRHRDLYAQGSSVNVYGVWWKNGQLHTRGERTFCIGSASSYYSEVTAAPTGDAHVEYDEFNGTVGSIGSNADAASWVRGNIITNTASTYGVNSAGAEKLYVTVQKIFGGINQAAGIPYIVADKVSAVVNGSSGAPNLLRVSGGTGRIRVNHWERETFTGETMKVSGGTANIFGGDLVCGTAKGFEITGGTARLVGLRIDTTGSASQNPVTKSGGTLFLTNGTALVAEATRDSIEAGTAQAVIAYGAFANRDPDANVTISVPGGLAVDASVS